MHNRQPEALPKDMIVDFHVHTVRGSSDSALSIDEMITVASLRGLDGILITEHNSIWHDEAFYAWALDESVQLLNGIEVSTNWGHIVVIGLPRYISGIHDAEVLRIIANRYHGFLIAAHPFRRVFERGRQVHNLLGLHHPTVEEAASHPLFDLVDDVEVLNSGTSDHENALAREIARRRGWPGIGASDSHSANSVGQDVTVIDRPVSVVEDLLDLLHARRYRPANGLDEGLTDVRFSIW